MVQTENPQYNEKLYKNLFHFEGNDGIFVHLPDDKFAPGKIFEVNDALSKLLGYSREEFLDMTVSDFLDEYGKADIPSFMRKLKQKGSHVRERTYITKTGRHILVEVSSRVFSFSDTIAVMTIVRDMTDKQRNQTALVKQRTILRSTLESTGDGILVVSNSGKVIEYSDSFLKLWRIPSEVAETRDDQILLKHILDQLKDPGEFISKMNSLYHGSKTILDEIDFIDGRVYERFSRPLLIDNRVEGRVWAFRDITEKTRLKNVLMASEEKYSKLFYNAPVWITITELVSAKYLEVNDHALKDTGFTREEVNGHTAVEIGWLTQNDTDLLVGHARQYGRITDLEMSFRSKDGRILWGLVNGEMIEIAGRSCLLTVTANITLRKAAENALKISEERYRNLFTNMDEGFALHEMIFDEDGKPCDYLFLEINAAFGRLTGLTLEQVVGRTVKEVIPGIEAVLIETYGKVVTSGEPIRFESYTAPLDRWYEIYAFSPYPNQFATIFVEITERKQNQRQLAEKNRLLTTIFESSPNILVLVDRDGRVLDINRSGIRFASRPKERLLGLLGGEVFNCLNSFVGPGCGKNEECQHCAIRSRVTRTFNSEIPIYDEEAGFQVSLDGRTSRLHIMVSTAPIDTPSGIHVLVSITDITERKKAEFALVESEKRYKELAELLPQTVCEIDVDGHIFFANKNAFSMFDYTPEDLGESFTIWKVLAEDDIERAKTNFKRIVNGEKVYENEYSVKTKTGRLIPVLIYTTPVRKSSMIAGFSVILVDISQRKQAEREITKLSSLYNVTSHVNQAVVHASSESHLFKKVCDVITKYGEFNLAWIGQADQNSKLVVPVSYGGSAQGYVKGLLVRFDDSEYGRGPTGRCIRESIPIIQNDFTNDSNTKPWHEKAKKYGFRGVAAFPILVNGRAWGALTVYSHEFEFFGQSEKALIEEVVRDIGFAMENFRKEQLLKRTMRNLELAMDAGQLGSFETDIVKSKTTHSIMCDQILGHSEPQSAWDFSQYLSNYIVPEDRAGVEMRSRIGLQSGLPWEMEYRIRRKDGAIRWIWSSVVYIRDAKRRVSRLYGVMKDITARKEFEMERAQLAAIVESTADAIIGKDIDGLITSWNLGAQEMYGYTAEEVIGKSISMLVPPESRDEVPEILRVIKSGETIRNHETKRIRKDGTCLDVLVTISPIKNASGMVNGASSIAQDITERHKAEQAVENALAEKEVLLKEIQHRVKNNMQVMISLLQMQSLRVKDPVDAKLFKDSQERIRSMALVYERLHQSSDLSRISLKHYVTSLVTGLVHSYNLSPVTPRTIIDVPDIPVSLDIAIPCGLIINEVISNSLKYAFPDDRCGTIRLKIEYTNPKMVLTMADDGIGLPEKVIVGRTSSMGMQLIFSLVEHQLGGKIKLDRSGGTRYEIVFSTAERRS